VRIVEERDAAEAIEAGEPVRLEPSATLSDRGRVARWAELYRESLYGWALRLTRDAEVAEDVVQETLVVALEHPGAAVPAATERAWLFGIARRLARRATQRRRSFLARLLRPSFDRAGPDDSGAQAAAAGEERSLVARAVGRLPPRQREVLYLVFYEGLSLDEAAHVMDLAPGSARQHYQRAKDALREDLSKCGAFDERA
jgi:RNA polymerase sigma-70 factor (ECF subfamily)